MLMVVATPPKPDVGAFNVANAGKDAVALELKPAVPVTLMFAVAVPPSATVRSAMGAIETVGATWMCVVAEPESAFAAVKMTS